MGSDCFYLSTDVVIISCVVVLVDTYTTLVPDNTYLELTPVTEYENHSKYCLYIVTCIYCSMCCQYVFGSYKVLTS